jgi:hypothetical protein
VSNLNAVSLKTRIVELLSKLQELAEHHKDAGRIPFALELEETVSLVLEWMRRAENTITAHQESIRILSEALEQERTG